MVEELESDLCIEFVKQFKCLRLLNQFKSKLYLFHVANERRASKQYYVKLSRMGVIPGIADYIIFIKGKGWAAIEFKRSPKEMQRLSDAQSEFKAMCEDFGAPYLLTCSVSEAIDFLKSL